MGEDRYDKYVIEDETWVRFQVGHTKRTSRVWISKESVRPQVAAEKLTNQKCVLLIAFTCSKRFSVRALPYGTHINGELYMDFVWHTGEKWRTLRSNPVRLNELVWQHDNARPHVKEEVIMFFQQRNVEKLEQAPLFSGL